MLNLEKYGIPDGYVSGDATSFFETACRAKWKANVTLLHVGWSLASRSGFVGSRTGEKLRGQRAEE